MASFDSSAAAAASAGAAPEPEVVLTSSDNEEFRVSLKVARLSGLVSNMLPEDESEEATIPLPAVLGKHLALVVQYCQHHIEDPMTEFVKPLQDCDLGVLVQTFYADFIEEQDNDGLFHLTLAANYMDIKPLLDLCCARIASFIKNKTVEEIRQNLGIVVDFTPEEEAAVRAENAWAEDLQ